KPIFPVNPPERFTPEHPLNRNRDDLASQLLPDGLSNLLSGVGLLIAHKLTNCSGQFRRAAIGFQFGGWDRNGLALLRGCLGRLLRASNLTPFFMSSSLGRRPSAATRVELTQANETGLGRNEVSRISDE